MRLTEDQRKAVEEMEKEYGDDAGDVYASAIVVVTAIRNKHGIDNAFIPKEDIRETMLCPVCEKLQMEYSISSYNGHRSAACECFGIYQE